MLSQSGDTELEVWESVATDEEMAMLLDELASLKRIQSQNERRLGASELLAGALFGALLMLLTVPRNSGFWPLIVGGVAGSAVAGAFAYRRKSALAKALETATSKYKADVSARKIVRCKFSDATFVQLDTDSDAGPVYFVRVDASHCLVVRSSDVEHLVEWPSKRFEMAQAPESAFILGIKSNGPSVAPVSVFDRQFALADVSTGDIVTFLWPERGRVPEASAFNTSVYSPKDWRSFGALQ